MRFPRTTVPLFALALAASGCGEDETPVDVNGKFSLSITNGVNECMIPNFIEGQSQPGAVTLTLTQDTTTPEKANGQIEGWIALVVRLAYGSESFSGNVTGSSLELAPIGGAPSQKEGACTYTRRMKVFAALTDNTLAGTIEHSFMTNGDASCGYRTNCRTIQHFNGTRPPKK